MMRIPRRKMWIMGLAVILIGPVVSHAQRPELIVQTGHSRSVVGMAMSADGKIVASKSDDGTVLIWDATTGRQLRKFKTGIRQSAIALTLDGKILAAGGLEIGEIVLWNVTNGSKLLSLSGNSPIALSVAFSADGKILAAGEHNVQLWEVNTGRPLGTWSGHTDHIQALAFSADNRFLASGADDKTVKLWEVASGKNLRTLTGHSARVSSVAFSGDGKIVASGSWDKTIKLWDTESGRALRTLSGHEQFVESIVISNDGRTLVSGSVDFNIKIWDVATGSERRTFEAHNGGVKAVALDTSGTILATAGWNSKVKIWDLATGLVQRVLDGHASQIFGLDFSHDGKALAMSRYNGAIKLWNLAEGKTPPPLYKNSTVSSSAAYSGDSKYLASAGNLAVEVWDLTSREPELKFSRPVEWANSVALSADGRILAWGGDDKKIGLWDMQAGSELTKFPQQVNGVKSVALTRDGKTLASCTYSEQTILWDAATGRKLRTLVSDGMIGTVAFAPDGMRLATGGFREVDIWETATGRKLQTLVLENQNANSVAFTADGKILASGNDDGTIILWETATGKKLSTLEGHTSEVTSVAFNPEGTILASGSLDYTTRLWDVRAAIELASLIAIDAQDWLVVTPDGLFDGTNAAWGRILWRFSPLLLDVEPVESFYGDYYYPGLLGDLLAGKRPKATQDISTKDRRQPAVTLTQPVGATVSGSNARIAPVRITISTAPAGAQDVRLFRDGSLVHVWHGDVLKGEKQVTLEASVPVVAGVNRLTAYAFNRDGIKSADANLTVKGASFLVRQGVAYVLAIGINEYANPQYNLRYATNDARDLAAELERQLPPIYHYPRVVVIPLLDRDATKANILTALSDLAAKAQPEDGVIIFFAGHGVAYGNRFYLIPHDLGYDGSLTELNEAGLQKILAHGISDEELERAVEGIDAEQLVMIIDACNSGQALEAEEKRRGPMNSKGLAQLAYEKGMYILTAAQSYQAALEASKLGHGYLTYALVEEGLKTPAADTAPKDGAVLLREWLDYATSRVSAMQQEKLDRGKPSQPVTTPEDKRLLLQQTVTFTNGEEQTDPAARTVQRPRVFYRREVETRPLVVARP
ncbi:MAG: caspase family protein [Pyrinomonadaceae bacterium]